MSQPTPTQPMEAELPPVIPDHRLIRRVGKGAYGEVWLAENVIGGLRAIKVIHRASFREDRPFQREFEGIVRFEPISRHHPGFVAVLHVGRRSQDGYFYYVMELADDVQGGEQIHADSYAPRTLRQELSRTPHPSSEDSLRTAVALADALAHLHRQGLVHRDIKPSNIIFVRGRPKLADIGLITVVGEPGTLVGTPGYISPEGPLDASADVYSLGMVLYELFMRKSHREFPALPLPLAGFHQDPILGRVNEIILKACDPDPRRRHASGAELHGALLRLYRETSRAMGRPVDPYLDPVSPRGSSPVDATEEAMPDALDPDRPLVCFVDDDREEVQIFRHVFSPELQILSATRFKDAMNRLKAVGRRPDLFVLDLYFPLGRDATAEEKQRMLQLRSEVETAQRKLSNYLKSIGQDREGGLRLMTQFREHYPDVPVVFYTRKGTQEDVTACIAAGAVEVIRKPQPEEMDPVVPVYQQLEEAAKSHKTSLLSRFESLCLPSSAWRRWLRLFRFFRKA